MFRTAAVRSALVVCTALAFSGCEDPVSPFEGATLRLQAFLDRAELEPPLQDYRVVVEADNGFAKLAIVEWGPPMDCPSGCFFAQGLLLETDAAIGWVDNIESPRLLMVLADLEGRFWGRTPEIAADALAALEASGVPADPVGPLDQVCHYPTNSDSG